jgi:hypothetical protein
LEALEYSGFQVVGVFAGRTSDSECPMQKSKKLTSGEFASLIEIADSPGTAQIAAAHLVRLVDLGYVLETPKGPVTTGDGLIWITDSE